MSELLDRALVPQPAPNESAAPFLFPATVIEAMETEESRFRGLYTAERLKLRHPKLFRAALALRDETVGPKRTAEILGLDHRTVLAAWAAEPASNSQENAVMITRIRNCITLLLERIEKDYANVPLHVAALQVSQLIDKLELLSGRATSRDEKHVSVDIYADWQQFVSQLSEEKQLSDEEVTEIPIPTANDPGIGLVAGKDGANAADRSSSELPRSGAGNQPSPAPSLPATPDLKSDVSRDPTQVNAGQVTALVTDPGHDPASDRAGGGGDPREASGPPAATDGPIRKF